MTMTEKIIALVDYENIGTLENVRLSRYERLILFTGPQQEFIRFPAVTYAGDISISVFQVANVSKNNVDFHLVFELGRLSATAPKETIFHIISNDKGYDGVIAGLCRAGRRCCRISSPCSAEKPKAASMVISNDEVLHLTDKVQSLSKKSAGNRPANTSSLMNYIKSLSGNTKGMALYGRVKEELIRRGVIAVYEKTVVWR
ncbi:PIN domain-containing protein [Klebsiella pneumoniae]